ncbi:3-hydroxyacyl-CoA dehydrogenase [Stutzerimonas marianensis]|uniref:3-hydroxyacyl-CoA dehydrogenase n=1 Tax=Stutzerimonas marianensis TaxID=2929513 RepID=UPI003C2CAD75
MSESKRPIAIVGAGSIGIAFSLVFARAGVPVRLYDPDAGMRDLAPASILERARALAAFDLLGEPPEQLAARVTIFHDLAEALMNVCMVQECAPERVELKREIFIELDRLAPVDAVLASASSTIPASAFVNELPGRARCLITHPGNPPYLLPVIEIVPAPFTADWAIHAASERFNAAGLKPVLVRKEVEGFVFNRLQGALLREAYCLVRDGVATVEDIDTVVRDGLGLRWSVIGPFETADLNTRGGIAAHAERLGPAYARMGAERGQRDPWTEELVAEVERQRREKLPLTGWEARVAWRDRELMKRIASRELDKGAD